MMVALLQDFLRGVGLTEKPGGSSVVSSCGSCLSVIKLPSPESGVSMVGDKESVRGDFCGGAVVGLVDEHLFDVKELSLVTLDWSCIRTK